MVEDEGRGVKEVIHELSEFLSHCSSSELSAGESSAFSVMTMAS